ncbi:MAG: flagellar motor protein MotB [Candidatus Zixiibacteriota bacterium]
MRKRRKTELHENHERWLLTYADLITLLLAFFIVMYSMSRIDAKKFGAMSSALSGALRGRDLQLREASVLKDQSLSGSSPLDYGQLSVMRRKIEESVEVAGAKAKVESEMTGRGLVIHITEGALFEEARANLTPGAREVLRVIGNQLKGSSNHIRVEGHTDPRPISTPVFPSNWELSTARATSVLRFLVDSTGIDPSIISALGFGEFRPRVPNTTPENMAQNRRVDIVVLSEELSRSEPTASAEPPSLTEATEP